MKYVDVVIDNNNDNTDRLYTYACEDDAVAVGSCVRVPFAKGNRLKTAYVFSEKAELSEPVKGIKNVEGAEDISLTPEAVATCIWMKSRYMCRYIEAVKCFTPSGKPSKSKKKRMPYANLKPQAAEPPVLNEQQSKVCLRIESAIEQKKAERFLLQGVTGSGKTEVYIHAIAKAVAMGRTAIFLLPEISLTTQMIERFVSRFGRDDIAVLHSRLSAGERYDEWMRIRNGEARIVIGARSAVFAPLENIGIIILDEEHETTYKSDSPPKYETAEVALKRLAPWQGVLVLGSATPSVVSAKRAKDGIYKYLSITKRYNEVRLPEVSVVDMRKELRDGNTSVFSGELFTEMERCLREKSQIILFLNRRGYSAFVSCRECGFVMRCPVCGLPLTFHKAEASAVCHYCGHHEKVPSRCPSCGGKYLKHFGFGTERLEEETAKLFPNAGILRIDFDTTRKKGSMDSALSDFRKGKAQILIGTQMVAKGLDFSNVALVGVVSADSSLNIPDFRSAERTFQLVTQAIGRAGRGEKQGKAVIQTYEPSHYAVVAAANQDYVSLYEHEIQQRQIMNYPPFCDLMHILVTSENRDSANRAINGIYNRLCDRLPRGEGSKIFPPQPAHLSKVADVYRFTILIKCPAGARRTYTALIDEERRRLNLVRKKDYLVTTDINPYSFL
ncbi:MAG: primosomal protein N' [Clostridia bacterium]|nr:primosomal protein N' [Clostridia bacterium]